MMVVKLAELEFRLSGPVMYMLVRFELTACMPAVYYWKNPDMRKKIFEHYKGILRLNPSTSVLLKT